jgi:hypothetical protein
MSAKDEHEVEFEHTGLLSDLYQIGGHLANIGEHLVIIGGHLAAIGHHLIHRKLWRRDGYWSGYLASHKDSDGAERGEPGGTGWTRARARRRLAQRWRDRPQEEAATP